MCLLGVLGCCVGTTTATCMSQPYLHVHCCKHLSQEAHSGPLACCGPVHGPSASSNQNAEQTNSRKSLVEENVLQHRGHGLEGSPLHQHQHHARPRTTSRKPSSTTHAATEPPQWADAFARSSAPRPQSSCNRRCVLNVRRAQKKSEMQDRQTRAVNYLHLFGLENEGASPMPTKNIACKPLIVRSQQHIPTAKPPNANKQQSKQRKTLIDESWLGGLPLNNSNIQIPV
jgi:hypothetical protein